MRALSIAAAAWMMVSGAIVGTCADSAATKAPAAKAPTAAAKAPAGKKVDTLKVIARVAEIPGTFPPNDLYNYVYVMKYRVIKVVSGTCKETDILVGQYNPLIARKQIKDKMDQYVDGDVAKFAVGDKHEMVLVRPIELVWGEALEDDYFDVEAAQKYYALVTNVSK
jgi:hypothetical protein